MKEILSASEFWACEGVIGSLDVNFREGVTPLAIHEHLMEGVVFVSCLHA